MPGNNNGIDLRILREQAGRTQAEMAALCHVSTRTWMRWEKDPGRMPRDAYDGALDLLERSVQIRKEITMQKPHDHGKVEVVFDPDYDTDPEDDFKPSRRVTTTQWGAYFGRGEEPYEGFEEEYQAWQKAQEAKAREIAAADGSPLAVSDTVHPDPEFDPLTGAPVSYGNEPEIEIDSKTGKAVLLAPTTDEDGQ